MEYLGTEKLVNKIKPLVSVCIQTYQNSAYISQCLDSILMQETDFPYEIILGEDDSTDGTREICQKYAERYPDLIRLFLRSENDKIYINGMKSGRYNFIENIKTARGIFIALCDGDDYWTDCFKLQKQVDLLKDNSELTVVYHKVKTIGLKSRMLNCHKEESGYFYFYDTLQGKQGSALSMLFPKSALQGINISDYLDGLQIADWPLECLCMLRGKGFYLEEEMGCYRMEGVGISRHLDIISYYRVRDKVCERLLELDISDEKRCIVKSFLVRLNLSLMYYNIVNVKWRISLIKENIRIIINNLPCVLFPVQKVKWKKNLRMDRLLVRLPLGVLLGVKNLILKVGKG